MKRPPFIHLPKAETLRSLGFQTGLEIVVGAIFTAWLLRWVTM
jgi:hypothetical protein